MMRIRQYDAARIAAFESVVSQLIEDVVDAHAWAVV